MATSKDASKVSSNAKEAAEKGADQAKEAVEDLKTAAKDGVDYASQKAAEAQQYVNRGLDQVSHAGESVADQVRRHPLASIAIAAGIGFLISRLVR